MRQVENPQKLVGKKIALGSHKLFQDKGYGCNVVVVQRVTATRLIYGSASRRAYVKFRRIPC